MGREPGMFLSQSTTEQFALYSTTFKQKKTMQADDYNQET